MNTALKTLIAATLTLSAAVGFAADAPKAEAKPAAAPVTATSAAKPEAAKDAVKPEAAKDAATLVQTLLR